MRWLLLALLVAAFPTARAADLLASEVAWGPEEATLVVRASGPSLRLSAEPAILVGLAKGELAATPRELPAEGTWRGMTGVVELVLRRSDPETAVDVVIEDAGGTGLWIEWPAAERATPLPGVLALLGTLAVARLRRRPRLR